MDGLGVVYEQDDVVVADAGAQQQHSQPHADDTEDDEEIRALAVEPEDAEASNAGASAGANGAAPAEASAASAAAGSAPQYDPYQQQQQQQYQQYNAGGYGDYSQQQQHQQQQHYAGNGGYGGYGGGAPSGGAHGSEQDKVPQQGKLFIGGISWETTEDGLRQHFGKYGALTDAALMKDKYTGQPRGFGFVTFADSTGTPLAPLFCLDCVYPWV